VGQAIRGEIGFDFYWDSTLLDPDGRPVGYPPSAVFDSAVWIGGQAPPLFAPQVAWVDSLSGRFRLLVAASQTAGLAPGDYRLEVGVTYGGTRSPGFDGVLRLTDVPGSATARAPYVTYPDLLRYYDQLPTLANYAADQTGFLGQRVDASDEFDRELVTRYDPRPGFVKRRAATPDPHLGHDVPIAVALAPTPKALSVAIKAGGVIVDRNVREQVARRAIALILDRQETTDRNTYREEAASMRAEADRLWRRFEVQVDTDADGTADLLVCRDVTLLPPGTAP
jgi:hypothetical protein